MENIKIDEEGHACWYSGSVYLVSPLIMQLTGLCDKNGKEIYEGDVLGLDDPEDESRCVVVFQEGAFKRDYNPCLNEELKNDEDYLEKDYVCHFDAVDVQMWKVIGNICENPELLTRYESLKECEHELKLKAYNNGLIIRREKTGWASHPYYFKLMAYHDDVEGEIGEFVSERAAVRAAREYMNLHEVEYGLHFNY